MMQRFCKISYRLKSILRLATEIPFDEVPTMCYYISMFQRMLENLLKTLNGAK